MLLLIHKWETIMKTAKLLLLSAVATTSFAASGTPYTFVAGDNSVETKICIAAVQNDVDNYKNTVKLIPVTRQRVNIHEIVANKLSCNDQDIFRFAQQFSANNTTAYISQFLDKRVLITREVSSLSSTPAPLKMGKNKTIIVTAN